MKTRYLLLGLVLLCATLELNAQKKLKQGFIHYKVTAIQNIELFTIDVKPLVPKMGIKIYFKDNMILTQMNTGMEDISTLENTDSRLIFLLMNMGMAKYAVRYTTDEMIAQKDKQGDYAHSIEYTEETKKISGYKCKLAILTFENNSQIFVYYTKKLAYANKNFTSNFYKLDGFPIQFTSLGPGGTQIEYTATVIKTKLQNTDILVIPPDYEETTMGELQKMLMAPTPE